MDAGPGQRNVHVPAIGDHGTVGGVALDRYGSLIAGTSTGGTCCKMLGRVGDSPLIGCGCYADVEAGGVSCTGWGLVLERERAAWRQCREGAHSWEFHLRL
ncbi:MAG: hypothetical protein DMG28_02710 [Acidobacteria bacterium]|nr:MAG: hypothetical protein DMG28_02710 [Acidobacteriota bacterium]